MPGAAILAAVLLAAVVQNSASSPPPLPDHYERMRVLSESVLGKRIATEAEIQELLLNGIKDPDRSVRHQAVGSIASIRTLCATPKLAHGQDWAMRLCTVGETLGALLEGIAETDSDQSVRREALRGFAVPVMYNNPSSPLPRPLGLFLERRFSADPSPAIRAEIVGLLAMSYRSEDPEVRRLALDVLMRALGEDDPYIVQSAGHHASRSTPPEALPLLVKQLKNPSHIARMGVAQGIAAYRKAAERYLPDLEAALAAETDDITRKTIAGTISVIRK